MEIKVTYDECNDDGNLKISYEDFGGDISNKLVEVYHYQKKHELQHKSVEWISFDEFSKLDKQKRKNRILYVDFIKLIRLVDVQGMEHSCCNVTILARNYDYQNGGTIGHDFSRDLFQIVHTKRDYLELVQYIGEEVIIKGREYANNSVSVVEWSIFEIILADEYENIDQFFRRDIDEDRKLTEKFFKYQEQNPKIKRITDMQLRNSSEKEKKIMEKFLDDCIKYQKIKIEGWTDDLYNLDNKIIEVFRIWNSTDDRYAVIEIWKSEVFVFVEKLDEGCFLYRDHFVDIDLWEYKMYFTEWFSKEKFVKLKAINVETCEERTCKRFEFYD